MDKRTAMRVFDSWRHSMSDLSKDKIIPCSLDVLEAVEAKFENVRVLGLPRVRV
jgi:hypothetical protein